MKGKEKVKNHSKEKIFSVKLVENDTDCVISLRENIRTYMNECGYTLAELSEIAEIPLDTFKNFMYERTNVCRLRPIVKLAKEFGISVDELVGAKTIPTETKESLQIMRRLPEHFRMVVRWNIRATERLRAKVNPKKKAINLLHPICLDGALKSTNDFDVLDVSYLPTDIRNKVYVAIKIPCTHYLPHYTPYHVLLIANDRPPKSSEHCVISVDGALKIVVKKDGAYYSIRDKKFRCGESEIDELIGYVAETHIIEE